MADGSDSGLREKHALLGPYLNERQRRLVAAADAQLLGHGGIATLSRITGLSRTTLHKGLQELKEGKGAPAERVRRAGGGRKRKTEQVPEVVKALEKLVRLIFHSVELGIAARSDVLGYFHAFEE